MTESRSKIFNIPAMSLFHEHHQAGQTKKIGLLSLVVLTFYTVSGGAFGMEDIVRAGGPYYALLGFILLAVWAIPETLIASELSTAMPESSGSVAWVTTAFGDFWGFQKGWLSWLSGIADNALYPILFLDTLLEILKNEELILILSTGWTRWLTIVVATLLLTYLNYRGLDIVGKTAIVICLLSITPFIIFCIIGSFKLDPNKWNQTPPNGFQGIKWRLFLNTFFWNINYWESAAAFSGEVVDPNRNYPLGMLLALTMVFLMTFVPILIGTGASSLPYTEWHDGSFAKVAVELGGVWLGYWMIAGSALSNIGMFEAEMSTDAWQVAGMAERGILPKCLGYRNRYGTPTYGILLSLIGVIFLVQLSFAEVVEMLNLLYCFGQIIEFLAFLELRRSHNDMPRPFRIPIGMFGACLLTFLPLLFIFIIMSFSTWMTLFYCVAMSVLGCWLYCILKIAEIKGWCIFENKIMSIKIMAAIKRSSSSSTSNLNYNVINDEDIEHTTTTPTNIEFQNNEYNLLSKSFMNNISSHRLVEENHKVTTSSYFDSKSNNNAGALVNNSNSINSKTCTHNNLAEPQGNRERCNSYDEKTPLTSFNNVNSS